MEAIHALEQLGIVAVVRRTRSGRVVENAYVWCLDERPDRGATSARDAYSRIRSTDPAAVVEDTPEDLEERGQLVGPWAEKVALLAADDDGGEQAEEIVDDDDLDLFTGDGTAPPNPGGAPPPIRGERAVASPNPGDANQDDPSQHNLSENPRRVQPGDNAGDNADPADARRLLELHAWSERALRGVAAVRRVHEPLADILGAWVWRRADAMEEHRLSREGWHVCDDCGFTAVTRPRACPLCDCRVLPLIHEWSDPRLWRVPYPPIERGVRERLGDVPAGPCRVAWWADVGPHTGVRPGDAYLYDRRPGRAVP